MSTYKLKVMKYELIQTHLMLWHVSPLTLFLSALYFLYDFRQWCKKKIHPYTPAYPSPGRNRCWRAGVLSLHRLPAPAYRQAGVGSGRRGWVKDLIFFEIWNIEVLIPRPFLWRENEVKGGYSCPRNWNVPFVMLTSLLKETINLGILSYVPIARYPLK